MNENNENETSDQEVITACVSHIFEELTSDGVDPELIIMSCLDFCISQQIEKVGVESAVERIGYILAQWGVSTNISDSEKKGVVH